MKGEEESVSSSVVLFISMRQAIHYLLHYRRVSFMG